MTPKDKAKELVRQFYSIGATECKQCALIAVDEIIFELKIRNCTIKYFEEVKQEIKNL
jgi:hypothetical protein